MLGLHSERLLPWSFWKHCFTSSSMVISATLSSSSRCMFVTAIHESSLLLYTFSESGSGLGRGSDKSFEDEVHSCDRKTASRTHNWSSSSSKGDGTSFRHWTSFGSREAFFMRRKATVAKSLSEWMTGSTSLLQKRRKFNQGPKILQTTQNLQFDAFLE